MWNVPINDHLNQIPKLYETEKIPIRDKLIYLHFFMGGCDWYIAEYDGDDLFFGYAILNSDYENAEWGYVSYSDLKSIGSVEFDEYWTVKKASEIEKIKIWGES